ncbi:hypothetical protein [Naasia sp. SYSU D00057]|uniref:hypothetical protein n=1 Tax=Naasia sp. SYSU D00057 TaxID=2817380 RepID=UPI001B30191F|nr:hypothetical protein [Naasia sp. SYSU D00057]
MRVGRILLVTLPVAGVLAGALLLVPPALAQVPSAPLASDSTFTLGARDGTGFVSVTLSAGWTRIGTGPFLPDDRATLVAPDGVYRVELELVPGSPSTPDGADSVPGQVGKELAAVIDAASWSTETLLAGNEVRYTSCPDGGDAVTVAIVDPPRALTAAHGTGTVPDDVRFVLVASAPADEAPRYRTVTADLVSSAVFSRERPAPSPIGEPQS